MSRFAQGTYFPRAGGRHWQHLVDLYGTDLEKLENTDFDLRRAEFHPAGENRVSRAQLTEWRDDLNRWAHDWGYPSSLNEARKSEWNVALGERLLEDTSGLPEAQHPAVWCWIATYLLPHFGVFRWRWPAEKDGEPPSGRAAWSRFGPSERNGLLIALRRVQTYGAPLATKATEQEFQSILNRPAFGRDQRVARVVLETLVRAHEDPKSYYGKRGGNRALDADDVCIELRIINSLRPLCFASDGEIVEIVEDAIARLPDYRKATNRKEDRTIWRIAPDGAVEMVDALPD